MAEASATVSASIDRYAVIGDPVAHSMSPRVHALFAAQMAQELTYERILAGVDAFDAVAGEFFQQGGRGLNVTLPCKFAACRWVDELEPEAAAAGSVNTIVPFSEQAGDAVRFRGHNTDGPGLLGDLTRNLAEPLAGRRLLLLGAGGAVNGVVRQLAGQVPQELVIANRTAARAQTLAAALRTEFPRLQIRGCSLTDLPESFDLVINGTSAGLAGQVPAISAKVVTGALCYDMVYGGETAFCRWALAAGARSVSDGLGMLVEQAALAFTLWTGKVPLTPPVIAELRTGS